MSSRREGDVYYIDDPSEKRGRSVGSERRTPERGRRRRRRRWLWLLVLPALAGLLYLLRVPILIGTARWLDVSQSIRPADYVLVLSGRPEVRPFYAAALYRAGLAGGVLLAKPKLGPEERASIRPPEHELTRRVLLQSGVFEIDILVFPGEVEDSLDEARMLAAFLTENRAAQVTVLTSNYNTRRTRQILRSQLREGANRVRVLGVPAEEFTAEDWWRSQPGLRAYLGELLKIPYFWLVR